MHLLTCGSFKSANLKKDWVRKSQIHKVPHLRNIRKSNKLLKPEIFGCAIFGFYLLTAHLWYQYYYMCVGGDTIYFIYIVHNSLIVLKMYQPPLMNKYDMFDTFFRLF
jgi:hypothetical protein